MVNMRKRVNSVLKENLKFFNKVAKFYDLINLWFGIVLFRLIKEVKIKNNSTILDAGCGTGSFLKILSKNKTLKLYGIDVSRKMLEIAKKKLKNRAKLSLTPVEKIDYRNKFDYIFSIIVMHHYSDKEKVIKNFYQSLKNNGNLIILDVELGKSLNRVFHRIEPANTRIYSKEEIYELLKRYKFKNIQQKRLCLIFLLNVGKKIL
jgi:ubiquinone/menaquinone biosynthesis C-methylase UbiE